MLDIYKVQYRRTGWVRKAACHLHSVRIQQARETHADVTHTLTLQVCSKMAYFRCYTSVQYTYYVLL